MLLLRHLVIACDCDKQANKAILQCHSSYSQPVTVIFCSCSSDSVSFRVIHCVNVMHPPFEYYPHSIDSKLNKILIVNGSHFGAKHSLICIRITCKTSHEFNCRFSSFQIIFLSSSNPYHRCAA
eukprot:814062_1